MQKETARDMWQGRMAAHEGGCKAMLVDGETRGWVIAQTRGLSG